MCFDNQLAHILSNNASAVPHKKRKRFFLQSYQRHMELRYCELTSASGKIAEATVAAIHSGVSVHTVTWVALVVEVFAFRIRGFV